MRVVVAVLVAVLLATATSGKPPARRPFLPNCSSVPAGYAVPLTAPASTGDELGAGMKLGALSKLAREVGCATAPLCVVLVPPAERTPAQVAATRLSVLRCLLRSAGWTSGSSSSPSITTTRRRQVRTPRRTTNTVPASPHAAEGPARAHQSWTCCGPCQPLVRRATWHARLPAVGRRVEAAARRRRRGTATPM